MKKIALLLPIFLLTSCGENGYSIQEAYGAEGEIIRATYSHGVCASFADALEKKYVDCLNMVYQKSDFDIEKTYFDENICMVSSTAEHCAVVHLEFLNVDVGPILYIDASTHYAYFNGKDSCYRSIKKMPSFFMEHVLPGEAEA